MKNTCPNIIIVKNRIALGLRLHSDCMGHKRINIVFSPLILQNRPWNLKTPKTWAHPKTPWSTDEEDKKCECLIHLFGYFVLVKSLREI